MLFRSKGSGVPDRLVWGREDSDLEAEAEAVAEVELDDRGIPSHGFWAHTVILDFCQCKLLRVSDACYSQRHERVVFCVRNLFSHFRQKSLHLVWCPSQPLCENGHRQRFDDKQPVLRHEMTYAL